MKEGKEERKKAYLELWSLLLNNFQNLSSLLPLFFLQKQVTKDIYLYRQTLLIYSYTQKPSEKKNLNFLSIILKDESLTTHCFHHNPFQSVLSRLPKVEKNHLHEIFTMIFIQLIFHFPLEMILPYLHGFFHFLGEINLSSPLQLFNFLHK